MSVSEWFVTIFGGVDDAIELFSLCFDNDFLDSLNGLEKGDQKKNTLKFKLTFTYFKLFRMIAEILLKTVQSNQQKKKIFLSVAKETRTRIVYSNNVMNAFACDTDYRKS